MAVTNEALATDLEAFNPTDAQMAESVVGHLNRANASTDVQAVTDSNGLPRNLDELEAGIDQARLLLESIDSTSEIGLEVIEKAVRDVLVECKADPNRSESVLKLVQEKLGGIPPRNEALVHQGERATAARRTSMQLIGLGNERMSSNPPGMDAE